MVGSRSSSVRKSFEFERAYREGVSYRGELFAVHAFPNGAGEPRLGLSVSKKVGRTAVVRNRVKRRLREVFHERLPAGVGGVDFVLSARSEAANATFEELGAEFERSIKRLGYGTD